MYDVHGAPPLLVGVASSRARCGRFQPVAKCSLRSPTHLHSAPFLGDLWLFNSTRLRGVGLSGYYAATEDAARGCLGGRLGKHCRCMSAPPDQVRALTHAVEGRREAQRGAASQAVQSTAESSACRAKSQDMGVSVCPACPDTPTQLIARCGQ
jgi:hypothetical protein